MTVLVSSHLLSEMDQMATHVGIIDKGQLIFQDSLAVLHEHSRLQLLLKTDNDDRALQILKRSEISAEQKGGKLYLRSAEDSLVIKAVSVLAASGVGVLRLSEQQMSLEDIFLHLTGRQVSL